VVLLRKIAYVLLGILSGVVGIVVIPTMLYHLCGVFNVQDCADGPKWVNALIVVVCAAMTCGGFFLAYRLFRRVAAIQNAPE
jgi:hypothetical protein